MGQYRTKVAWDAWGDVLTEPPAARRRRLNEKAKDGKTAKVTDRSGSVTKLEHAAKKLRAMNAEARVLRVPQKDMDKAVAAMERAGVSGRVSNLCGSRKVKVRG